jgi:diacylglycerol kinase
MASRFRPRTWRQKFGHSLRGARRAVRTQSSFAVHLLAATGVVAAAAVLRVTLSEWGLLVFAIGIVLVAETFNTAVESLARAVDTDFHPRIRDALDMASAAVLVAALTAVAIGCVVFLPHLWPLLAKG